MKTKDIIGAGLCTILLASPVIMEGQIIKKDSQKEKLEIMTEKKLFTGTRKDYNLEIDTTVYHVFTNQHKKPYYDTEMDPNSILDNYYCSLNWYNIPGLDSKQRSQFIEHTPEWTLMVQKATFIEEIYAIRDFFESKYSRSVSGILAEQRKNGNPMRVKSRIIDSRNIHVDHCKAERKRMEFWLADSIPKPNVNRELIDRTKGVYIETIFQAEDYYYGIFLFSQPIHKSESDYLEPFYDAVTGSIKLRK